MLLLVVVSLPRFTIKPPPKIVARSGCYLTLNCSATGDPQPIISWRKLGGQLPVGRSQQINGALVMRDLQTSDAGNYVCVATSAGVFNVEAVTFIEVKKGNSVLSASLYITRKCFDYKCRLRGGAVVRALAYHQSGPIPGLGVTCELSLLLILFSAPRGFSPGTPVFPSPQKPTLSKFQFDPDAVGNKSHYVDVRC